MKEIKKSEDIKLKSFKHDDYQKIIFLPPHISKTHPQMSKKQRAAQFIPFLALSGFLQSLNETARQVTNKIILDEADIEMLNKKILLLSQSLNENPKIQIVYFEKDLKKEGGTYKTIEGKVKKINFEEKLIVFEDLTIIYFENIYQLNGSIFDFLEYY